MQDLDIFNSQISTSVSLIFSALKQSKVGLLNSNDVSSEYSKTWVKDTNRVRLPPVQEEERRHVQRLHLRREVGEGLISLIDGTERIESVRFGRRINFLNRVLKLANGFNQGRLN